MTVRFQTGDRLVLASHNKGKIFEFRGLLAPFGVEVVPSGELGVPEPDETGTTFAANARLKAEATAAATGLPALADDSGLEVEALDGAPGVYSARWAGDDRDFGLAMRRVRDELVTRNAFDTPPAANFTCVLCLALPDGGGATLFEGKVLGHLSFPPRGKNGFGYDPIFVPHGYSQTFSEMDPESKQLISHRYAAFTAFARACLGA